MLELKADKAAIVQRQRAERATFIEKTELRLIHENQQRQAQFRPGIKGLWDRIRGEHKRIQEQNTIEAQNAFTRDHSEKDQLIFRQMAQRREFTAQRMEQQERYIEQRQELNRDVQTYEQMRSPPKPQESLKADYIEKRQKKQEQSLVRQCDQTLKP